jgi:hypothetical protein
MTFCLAAQARQQADSVVFRFTIRSDMFFLRGNEAGLERLYAFTDRYHAEITSGKMPVRVDGYCPDLKIARVRSNRVKSQLIVKKGLKEEHFITRNHAESHHGEADVVVVSFVVVKAIKEEKEAPQPQPAERPDPEPKQPEPEVAPVEKPRPEAGPAMPAVPDTGYAKFSLHTNLLYWALATPNLGVEWRLSERTGLLLNGAFSHWIWNDKGNYHNTWLAQPEIRRYLGASRRWFAGIEAHAAQFNFKFGGTGYQGDAFGGGLTGGYRLRLSACFDMDFSLGLGYTRLAYDTYYRDNGVMVREESGIKKNLFTPTRAAVSLVWKIK